MDDFDLDEEYLEPDEAATRLVDDDSYQPCVEPLPHGVWRSKKVEEWHDDSDEDGPGAFRLSVRTVRVTPAMARRMSSTPIVRHHHHLHGARQPRSRRAVVRRASARDSRDGPARSSDDDRESEHPISGRSA